MKLSLVPRVALCLERALSLLRNLFICHFVVYLHFLISHPFLKFKFSFCPRLWNFFLESHKWLSNCQTHFPILLILLAQSVWAALTKYHSLGELKTSIPHRSGDGEVYQGASMGGFWRESSSWFTCRVLTWQRALASSCASSFEGHKSHHGGSPFMNLLPSWRPHLPILSRWGSQFQHTHFGEIRTCSS